MLPTPLRDALAALALLLCCLAGWGGGCAPSTLSHPAILGASASAGFGCETTVPPDNRAVLVDMESVYNASVPGWHGDPLFLADASFYTRARTAAKEQMDAALAANPSMLVAIDYLFWSVYHGRDSAMSPDNLLRDRLDALEQALAQLDRFQGPILVGDIPDMSPAIGRMLSKQMVPPPDQLATFNQRIHQWAAARSASAPAIIVPTAQLALQIQAKGDVTTSYGPLSADNLIQKDQLHPTPTGLAAMLREGLHGLADRKIIGPTDFRSDLADITSRLPNEALSVGNRREPGLWSLLALKGKMKEFGDALENKDCTTAATRFDEMLEKVSRLKKPPAEMADLYVSFTLFGYRSSCADSGAVVRRWRDKLAPEIERPLPDAWPLILWDEFNSSLDQRQLTVERMLRLKREHPEAMNEYKDSFSSAARATRFTDAHAYLELLPDWRKKLESSVKGAKGIADYWIGQSKLDSWPKTAQENFDRALRWESEEGKKELAKRRDQFNDPKYYYVRSREITLEDFFCLDRALTLTGRDNDAAEVRAALEAIADADEIAKARKAFDKEVAEAAEKKPLKP
ncbi:MAG: hypothetical protein QM783_20155 [Phycisphaerales bacterium]